MKGARCGGGVCLGLVLILGAALPVAVNADTVGEVSEILARAAELEQALRHELDGVDAGTRRDVEKAMRSGARDFKKAERRLAAGDAESALDEATSALRQFRKAEQRLHRDRSKERGR